MAEFQNVYDDLRNKLIARGIPAEEIAYIHTANTEAQKKELFGKVRSGQVRVLIGSTQKMARAPMSRRNLWHCTTWTVPGGLRPSAAGGSDHPAGQRE